MNELIKPIPGFKNYLITESGKIFNAKTKKQLKPGYLRGYKIICLMKNAKKYMRRVARLNCHAWHGALRPDQTVDHIDGDKDNDHRTNLRKLTLKQNIKAYWGNKRASYV